jgi:uncharacterized protein YjiS (DUF1127 family)
MLLQSLIEKLPRVTGAEPASTAGEARWTLLAFWSAASRVLREAYAEWRYERDLRAITHALDRLSDRQLRLIGMRRESLICEVEALADRTREGASVAREVKFLLDAPARLPLPRAAAAAQTPLPSPRAEAAAEAPRALEAA